MHTPPLVLAGTGLTLAATLFLALPAAAICGPKLGSVQVVVNPPPPDPDIGSVSTIRFFCPDFGCHSRATRENPVSLVTWTISNDADDHVRACTWNPAPASLECQGDHGWHAGHWLTSTFQAPEAPQAAEMLWFPCPTDVL